MLLALFEGDAREGGAVESDSGPEADDGGREEQFVEDGRVDGSEGPAVGTGQFSILLDPSGLDVPGGNDQHHLLQLLLQVGDQLLVGIGQQDFVSAISHADKDEGLIFFVGDLLDFVDDDGVGEFLVLGVDVASGVEEGLADLVLEVGEVASLGSLGAFEDVLDLAGVSHCGSGNLLN